MKTLTQSNIDSALADVNRLRRQLLTQGLMLGGAAVLALRAPSVWAASSGDSVSIEAFSPSGKSQGVVQAKKLVKSDADWRKQLNAEQYTVTRQAGTEQAFTGQYANNHADGLYRCICCDTALYDSRTKFESGTGWPSFYQPISKLNVVEATDNSYGMERTAISCKLCDAHLGHVFNDGPLPTGLRYCMNSAALHFAPRAAA